MKGEMCSNSKGWMKRETRFHNWFRTATSIVTTFFINKYANAPMVQGQNIQGRFMALNRRMKSMLET